MKMPIFKDLPSDGTMGPAARELCGTPRYYRMAIYNTLLHMMPKYCLEIGTNMGETAYLFGKYFQHFQPEGFVVTTDVGVFHEVEHPNVKQVLVYPHVPDVDKHCDVPIGTMLPNITDEHIENSIHLNFTLLTFALNQLGAQHFDFCFLDGDHYAESVRKDLELVKLLVKPPHYCIIDDVDDYHHEVAQYYHDVVKKEWRSYEFEDWDVYTGCALIWSK